VEDKKLVIDKKATKSEKLELNKLNITFEVPNEMGQ